MDNSRIKLIVEGIIIIAVVLLIAIFASQRTQAPKENLASSNISQIAFPSDVPLLSSGTIQSSDVPASSGQFQVRRSFEAAQTADINFSFYKQFFSTTNGWTVLAQVNNSKDPAHKSMLVRNNQGMLTLNVIANSSSASAIDMVFITNPLVSGN